MTEVLGVLSSVLLLVPVALGVWARRPWHWIGLVLWLLLPVVVFVAMVLWEMQASGPNPDAARNAWFGFYLLSAVFVLPWLIYSGVAFGVGLLLRRRFGPKAAAPAPAPAPAAVAPRTFPGPAWAGGEAGDPNAVITSPDGRIRIELRAREWANGQWVRGPRVTDTSTGRVLLDLDDTEWDFEAAIPLPESLVLHLRRYPSPGAWRVELHLPSDRFSITMDGHPNAVTGRIENLRQGLLEVGDLVAAVEGRTAPPPPRPGPFAAWRTAVVIFVAAAIAIGALTALTYQPPKAVPLDVVPRMPPRIGG